MTSPIKQEMQARTRHHYKQMFGSSSVSSLSESKKGLQLEYRENSQKENLNLDSIKKKTHTPNFRCVYSPELTLE